MPLRNKVLIIILGLVLLNLVREYIWMEPSDAEFVSIDSIPRLNFDIQRKEWGYYSSVFDRSGQPIKSVTVSLPLVLRGTVISNPHRSFAIIEDLASGTQDLYRLGDIVSGAKIVAMNRNRVVLDYNGTKQELILGEVQPRPDGEIGDGFIFPRRCRRGNMNPSPISPTSPIGVDFAKIMTQLRIKPYFSGGRCIGFQLNNINNDFIKQMGLQDGDIVESINGVYVDDPLKALQILYSIEKNNPVHIGIERRDEKVELDCKIEG